MMKITTQLTVLSLAMLFAGCEPQQSGGNPPQQKPDNWPPEAPQAAAVVPDSILLRRNFYLVFDGSGSMDSGNCAGNSRRIDVAKKAAIKFSQSLKAEDNLALLAFDGHDLSQRVALGTNNRPLFEGQVNAIRAGGGTPLYQSIGIGFDNLKQQMAKQLNYGEYYLVVITDGEASDSENGLVDQINRTSPVMLHVVGFCIGPGHSLNQRGKTHYTDAQNPQAVVDGLKAVLAESEKFDK